MISVRNRCPVAPTASTIAGRMRNRGVANASKTPCPPVPRYSKSRELLNAAPDGGIARASVPGGSPDVSGIHAPSTWRRTPAVRAAANSPRRRSPPQSSHRLNRAANSRFHPPPDAMRVHGGERTRRASDGGHCRSGREAVRGVFPRKRRALCRKALRRREKRRSSLPRNRGSGPARSAGARRSTA